MKIDSDTYERIPYVIFFQYEDSFKETYGGSEKIGILKAHYLKPKNIESDTIVIFMHPVGGGEYLPYVMGLAAVGIPVLYCGSRYPNNDSALIMEKVLIDLGNAIRFAKTELGFKKVVLAGWSGGGSLSLFYQSQAEKPTITHTPAGDPLDLSLAKLTPADGIILVAAHVDRSRTLTEWLDPSILDETNPYIKDPELDIYNPENPNQPPYSVDFINRYREAQVKRNRRITAWVKEKLIELKEQGKNTAEHGFVVHGTMADLRWLDSSIDSNDRQQGTCYLGNPEQVNNGPVGLARFCNLRSWLSQWSYDDSKANGVECAKLISIPALVIGNTADNACTPSHTLRLFDAIGHTQKEMCEIKGANHYYLFQPNECSQAVWISADWLKRNQFFK